MRQHPILVITGPTATGKTELGVRLAQAINGEVVSADSMQIYRGMDIGTAKPSLAERDGVPHHMFDVADPAEGWSAARYVEEASACVEDILSRGKHPILVGGTGLYIDSLLAGRQFAAAPSDPALRDRLCAEYDAEGGDAFRARLSEMDPERAEKLPSADKRRLVRAMEIFLLTGHTMTEHDLLERSQPPRYASLRFAISFAEREILYSRIDTRVDIMAQQGLFEEVRRLLDAGLSPGCTAMQAIGYKEAAAALCGELSREEALENIKRASRRYAKRQLTWLRRDSELHWLLRDRITFPQDALEQILETLDKA
ncbi:MAG: tRNA (adenosine(37)-N6)-dimethylallyltransferase MiaA [Eubacteriales bacterium]|nr:tRNA (adenosine(37)-N6)-dimethylallyltransferase MiaA [Eubacteriales bacterium]